MSKDDKWLLQPYFTPMIEKEFPELIEARKEFERDLEQSLRECEENA